MNLRTLTADDAPSLVEATSRETGRALWDSHPESRGKGLATKALNQLTTRTHDEGYTHLWLEIRPDNEASQRVATRADYKHTERIPNDCEAHDCLIWTHDRTASTAR